MLLRCSPVAQMRSPPPPVGLAPREETPTMRQEGGEGREKREERRGKGGEGREGREEREGKEGGR